MKKDYVADYDYEFEEKHKTVAVSEQGVAKAEEFLGISHLYRAENGPLVNHLQQALKAESLYKRDVDYAVIDGEVMIIDEFTGRILEGRRWSEGLHQAIEAKEGVHIQEENQTLAMITLQNYFRLYDKLSGMTGTALTEATEFMKIYKLPVVQIPTNQPMVRDDGNDQVFKTKGGKWHAVITRSRAPRARPAGARRDGLGRGLRAAVGHAQPAGIKHVVLNAKPEFAEREGEIVAEAGQPGAVTIATNMAGRGVDIKLGGNPEHLTEIELKKLGLKPGDPDYDERYADILPSARAPRRGRPGRRSSTPAASTSSAPSATSHAGSTTSCAAAPAARAIRASRASSSRPRTISCACSPATGSTRSSTASAPSTRRATRSRSRPACSPADREGAEEGRGAELPAAQARARVRRRHERAAPDHLQVPRRDPRGQGLASRSARRSATSSSARSASSRPATSSRTGTSRACSPRWTTCSRSR